jgi:hypothetical protein
MKSESLGFTPNIFGSEILTPQNQPENNFTPECPKCWNSNDVKESVNDILICHSCEVEFINFPEYKKFYNISGNDIEFSEWVNENIKNSIITYKQEIPFNPYTWYFKSKIATIQEIYDLFCETL